MAELSYRHVNLITDEVTNAGISLSHLQYDLIDHICCHVENEMDNGLSFENAFAKAKQQFGIGGLARIQEETLLLIDKTYRIMKTTMKIFGVIAPIVVAFGTLFKIEHWPGAGILLTLGFFLLAFVFLPSAVYISYREVSNKTRKLAHFSGFLAGFLLSISFLFKIQHWPGTPILMFAGVLVAGLVFLPAVFIDKIKAATTARQRFIYIIGWLGSMVYLAGFLFKVSHWPGAKVLLFFGALVVFVIAFPMYVYFKYKDEVAVKGSFIFLAVAAVWVLMPTMLFSLNKSQNAMDVFDEIKTETQTHIQYVTSKNAVFYEQAKISGNGGDVLLKKQADTIKVLADAVFTYIGNVKSAIIEASAKSNETDAINSVLFDSDNGEAKKIKEKLIGYQRALTQILVANKISLTDADHVLAIQNPQNVPQGFKTWEEFYLKSTLLVTAVNKLEQLQEDVRVAENFVLQELFMGHGVQQKQTVLNH